MANSDQTFLALAEFARTLTGRYAIADVLFQLTDQVVGALGNTGAGVSVADDDDKLRFVTSSTDDLIAVERAQEEWQQGACVAAFRSCDVVVVDDLTAETRWPEYRAIALETGFKAVAAIPLRSADGCIGSLNLYESELRQWLPEEIARAMLFADMAASYVAYASDLQRSERVREQLQRALDSRIVIEQAKGILAEYHNISIDDAYRKLRQYTRSHQAHLHEVANAIVNLGLRVP